MLTSGINFINFKNKNKTKNSNIRQKLNLLLKEKSQVIKSLGKNYKKFQTAQDHKRVLEGIKNL